MIRLESSRARLPQAPNIIAPRQRGLTLTPVRPSNRCSNVCLLDVNPVVGGLPVVAIRYRADLAVRERGRRGPLQACLAASPRSRRGPSIPRSRAPPPAWRLERPACTIRAVTFVKQRY